MRHEWQAISDKFTDQNLIDAANTYYSHKATTAFDEIWRAVNYVTPFTDPSIFIAQALAQRLKAWKENTSTVVLI